METPETKPATGDTAPTTPPAPEAPATPPAEDSLGDAGKRALDAERTARKAAEKAAADALAKVKEFEDAQKSDADKAAERLKTAETTAAEATGKLARIEAAIAAGLDVKMAERLRGSNADELKADADALKALLTPADGSATPPPGSLDGGPKPPTPKKSLDDQIAEATTAGNWDAVNALNAQKLMQLRG